jgi:hypothetical protein
LLPLVVLLLLGATGCTSDDEPVTVRVCGDLEPPDDIDAIRVVILDESGNEVRSGVRPLVQCPEDTLRMLPQRFEFRTVPDEGSVVAQALSDEVVIAGARVRSTFERPSTIEVAIESSCIGAQCGEDETCIDGACEFAPTEESGLLACPTGSTPSDDADLDAETGSDAENGTEDAGSDADAGPRYCPGPEGGQPN